MSAHARALLVSPVSPWGPSFGSRQRTALLYEALAALMPVDVLVLEEGARDAVKAGDRPEVIAQLTWKLPDSPLRKYGVHEAVNRWCQENLDWRRYTLAVGRYVIPISKLVLPAGLPAIVDCDDAFFRPVPAASTLLARSAARARGWLRFRLTSAAIRRYGHAFFCSPREQAAFRCPSSSVLPNVVPVQDAVADAGRHPSPTVLMVGSMWWPPNRHGADWFLERCWPQIAARCPALTLRIVGPVHERDRLRWGLAPRTEVGGFVDDLAAEYRRALFAIAPIHYGGGTCIKFLEAGAHGRASVTTAYVHGGYDAEFCDGESVLVARDAAAMVRHCLDLYEHPERREAVARRARDTVGRCYTVERFRSEVHRAVRAVVGRGPVPAT